MLQYEYSDLGRGKAPEHIQKGLVSAFSPNVLSCRCLEVHLPGFISLAVTSMFNDVST